MKFALLLILYAFATTPLRTYAEVTTDYLEVHCNPARQQVTAEFKSLSGQPPDEKWYGTLRSGSKQRQSYRLTAGIDYAECALAPGQWARIKLWQASMHGGRCGGDPPVSVSLWVGQRKWLDKHWIAGDCADRALTRMIITPRKVVLCDAVRYEQDSDGASDVTHAPHQPVCKTYKAANLARGIDRQEYPKNPAKAPIPGSVVFDLGADTPLCRQMVEPLSVPDGRRGWRWKGIPDSASVFESVPPGDGGGGSFSVYRYRFDIDNDGVTDRIYHLNTDNRSAQSDSYTVVDPATDPDSWPDFWTDVVSSGTYSFPQSHALCDGRPCTADDDDMKGRLALSGAKGQGHEFVLNRLRAWPFAWDGRTHFLISDGTAGVNAVVLPSGRAALQEICVFREIPR